MWLANFMLDRLVRFEERLNVDIQYTQLSLLLFLWCNPLKATYVVYHIDSFSVLNGLRHFHCQFLQIFLIFCDGLLIRQITKVAICKPYGHSLTLDLFREKLTVCFLSELHGFWLTWVLVDESEHLFMCVLGVY